MYMRECTMLLFASYVEQLKRRWWWVIRWTLLRRSVIEQAGASWEFLLGQVKDAVEKGGKVGMEGGG